MVNLDLSNVLGGWTPCLNQSMRLNHIYGIYVVMSNSVKLACNHEGVQKDFALAQCDEWLLAIVTAIKAEKPEANGSFAALRDETMDGTDWPPSVGP